MRSWVCPVLLVWKRSAELFCLLQGQEVREWRHRRRRRNQRSFRFRQRGITHSLVLEKEKYRFLAPTVPRQAELLLLQHWFTIHVELLGPAADQPRGNTCLRTHPPHPVEGALQEKPEQKTRYSVFPGSSPLIFPLRKWWWSFKEFQMLYEDHNTYYPPFPKLQATPFQLAIYSLREGHL